MNIDDRMLLIKQNVRIEINRLKGDNVLISNQFFVELCDPKNNLKSETNYNNLIRVIGYYSFFDEDVRIGSLDDLDTVISEIGSSRKSRKSNGDDEKMLQESERELRLFLKAVIKIIDIPEYKSMGLINQKLLCKHIQNGTTKGISQAKLSKMLTEKKEFHVININQNWGEFGLLVKHIRNFKNLTPMLDS